MRDTLRFFLAAVVLLSMPATSAAQAPIARPDKLTSFKRSNGQWDVTTTVWLRADGVNLKGLKFQITRLPALGDLSCSDDGAPAEIGKPLVPPNESSAYRCVYKPKVGLTGPDYIYYHAATGDGSAERSQPARIDIDVQSRGLRWEFIPAGSSGLSSDNVNEGSLPDILGKNAQDFIFVLNWVVNFPEANVRRQPGASVNAVPFITSKSFTPSMALTIRTGLETSPMAVEAIDRGSASAIGSPETSSPAESRTGFRRAFTFSGQWDGNLVFKSDGAGSYMEVGTTVKAGYNIATETETIEVESNRLIQLLTKEKGTFNWEAGFRFALKQDEDEFGTTIFERRQDGGDSNAPAEAQQKKNAKELFVFEWLYQRDNALEGVPGPPGRDPTRRIVWRAIGIPNIKGLPLPNRMRPYIGIEVTCVRNGILCVDGDDEIMRVLYGVNFSAR